MIRILYVTAHMGGGVGNAISTLNNFQEDCETKILILEKPEKKNF